MRTDILVFGGAFDPPTIGHRALLECISNDASLSNFEVWVMPCFDHKFGKHMTDSFIRLGMCFAMVKGLEDNVKVSSLEIEIQHRGSTYDILCYMKSVFPQFNFSLLIGGDNLCNLHKWQNYQLLVKEFPIVSFMRFGNKEVVPNLYFKDLQVFEAPTNYDVSSTMFRQALAENDVNFAQSLLMTGVWEIAKLNYRKHK